jgi:hypothetical protein
VPAICLTIYSVNMKANRYFKCGFRANKLIKDFKNEYQHPTQNCSVCRDADLSSVVGFLQQFSVKKFHCFLQAFLQKLTIIFRK